jgi:hypothetical protein
MTWQSGIKLLLLLAFVTLCFLGYVLHRYSNFYRLYEAALLALQWMLLICPIVWGGTFLFLTFRRKDWLLITLQLVAIIFYFIDQSTTPATEAITLLIGATLGRGAQFILKSGNQKSEIFNFLVGLVVLLAVFSWWHLDMADNYYHGPRWMGLWNNPNLYGSLMGVGVVLTVGLLGAERKAERDSLRASSHRLLPVIFFIAAGMMAVGLLFSYSRGSWAGAAAGLLYLAWAYEKLKWRFVLAGILVVAVGAWFFWHATADTAPWYVKRLDLGRPSAQNRVAAWHGALQMMWDHPLGVGWNKAVEIYAQNYSPPEDGAAALNTNDYLMLGTQLGFPGLFCFVAYVGLCFRNRPHLTQLHLQPLSNPVGEGGVSPPAGSGAGIKSSSFTHHSSLQAACLAGTLTLLVAFWFDGGLFKLPTAVVFWILLELGTSNLTADRKPPTWP